jgi:CBS domain-containing protein
VTEDTSVEDIVQLMERHHIKRLPVVRGEILAGIITRANLLRALVREAGRTTAVPATDAGIKDALLAELKQQPWGSTPLIDVSVQKGVVLLQGAIMDERQRGAIVVAASNVPGVHAIEDRMALVEPVAGMAI